MIQPQRFGLAGIIGFALVVLCTACASSLPPDSGSRIKRKSAYSRDIPATQRYYTVKPGDTLYAIGFRSGKDYKTLADWNDLKPPYIIQVDQKLRLFPPAKNAKKKPDSTQKRQPVNKKRHYISNNKENNLKLTWNWPLKGKVTKKFTATARKGIDIQARPGQQVTAAEAGKVVYAGSGLRGYGNLVIIKHNETFLSAYGHNRKLLVQEGQWVNKAQVIAEAGKSPTGQVSLHFQIRKLGKPVDPLTYLP